MEKQNAIAALGALAHETRLDVFRLLVQAGPKGLAAGAIAAELGLPGGTLSFHLKELRSAGIVEMRRESRSLIYSPRFDAMGELVAYLGENCCQRPSPAPSDCC